MNGPLTPATKVRAVPDGMFWKIEREEATRFPWPIGTRYRWAYVTLARTETEARAVLQNMLRPPITLEDGE